MMAIIELIESDLLQIKSKHKNILKVLRLFSLGVGVDIRHSTHIWHPILIILLILLINAVIIFVALLNYILDNLHLSVFHYADSFCMTLQLVVSIIKELFLWNKHNYLYEIIHTAENSHTLHTLDIFLLEINGKYELWQQLKNIIKKSWLDIERQLRFFIWSVCMTVGLYVFTALVKNIYHLYHKDQHDGNFEIIFSIPVKYPEWTNKGSNVFVYSIKFINVASVHYIAGFVPICFDGIFVITVIHCSALLKILRTLIQNSTSVNVPKRIRIKYLLCCIRFYQKILNYQLSINNLYMHINLAQYVFSIIILCMLMFQYTTAVEVNFYVTLRMTTYIMAVFCQNILYCWNAQKLITESHLLPLSWYECEWYNESKEFRRLIQMMIMRTNQLLYMRLSGFGAMSMVTLLFLLRKSYSFFLLLSNVNRTKVTSMD